MTNNTPFIKIKNIGYVSRTSYKKRMPATFDEHEKNEFLHNSLTKTYTLLFIAIYVPQIKKVVIN
ncbi:MAG: hypothetical protein RLZZ292_38 [Bacteroidota bacterium]|jgi:hypothetical protein